MQQLVSHKNQFLRRQIYQIAKSLQNTEDSIICGWTPGHSNLEKIRKAT